MEGAYPAVIMPKSTIIEEIILNQKTYLNSLLMTIQLIATYIEQRFIINFH